MADSKSTADVISDVVDKVGDGLAQIGAAIQSHAPEAWALVVKGNYAIAAAGITIGIGLLIVAIVVAVLGLKVFCWGKKVHDSRESPRDEDGTFFMVVGFLMCMGAGIISIVGMVNFDSHNIAMLLAPEGTTARDILLRALGR